MTGADFPPAPEYGHEPQYPIESVDNALKVLLLLGERPRLRMTDVSHYLGVATSTAHRLLATLQFRGFVKQDESSRSYMPGPTLDGLAFGVLRRSDVRTRAQPILERLSTELEETVHLGRLEGDLVHFISSFESSRALRVGGREGRSMSAHCTSTGKVLLANLSEAEFLALYPDEGLPQLTTHSIGSRRRLHEVLAEIRSHGYATSNEESEDGVSSIAVALHSTHGAGLAVTASLPEIRMSDAKRREIVQRVAAAVEELDQLLV